MKTASKKGGADVSPYTPQNVDIAITHLERVLYAPGGDSLFAPAYWRNRVLQVYATRGLMQAQQERLQRLLDRLASVPTDFSPRARAARILNSYSGRVTGIGSGLLTGVAKENGTAA
jgi:hypothetical protein